MSVSLGELKPKGPKDTFLFLTANQAREVKKEWTDGGRSGAEVGARGGSSGPFVPALRQDTP